MSTRKNKLIIWLMALSMILACVPSLATPLPPLDPGAVNTFIAQTVNAASTQTAAKLPTSTPTASLTPTPRNTDTPSPTITSTVIFIFSTPTSAVIPTFTGLSGTSSVNFACQLLKVAPVNGSTFAPRADFDAKWTVKNIGRRAWEAGSTDYIYASGDIFHKKAAYDLGSFVGVGKTTDIVVDMLAPKNTGTFTTYWTLRTGNKTFCKMGLTINVH